MENKKVYKINYSMWDDDFTFSAEDLKLPFGKIYDCETLFGYKYIFIELVETDYNNTFINTILKIKGILFDNEFIMNNHLNFFEIYDSIDGDVYSLYDAFFEDNHLKDKYYSISSPNIFYLDRLWVNKEYRNQGYATTILKQLYDILKYYIKLNVGVIAIYAQPYDIIDNSIENVIDEDLSKKLYSLYEKCGYDSIKGTSYFYKMVE